MTTYLSHFQQKKTGTEPEEIKQQPIKRLKDAILKFDRSPIKPDPDSNSEEFLTLFEAVPNLLEIIQSYAFSPKIEKPVQEVAIHSAFSLKQLSDDKKFRKPLGHLRDAIEILCSLLLVKAEDHDIPPFPGSKRAMRRCQQHCLGILENLATEAPDLENTIINDESFVPGICNVLCSTDKNTQQAVATILLFFCRNAENHSLICFHENFLESAVRFLHQAESLIPKKNVLRSIVLLSNNEKTRFIMPRTSGFLEEISECLKLQDADISFLVASVIHNICLLKENIPLIAKNNQIRKVIDVLLKDKKQPKDMQKIIKKQANFVVSIIQKYENRFSNEEILAGTGFHSLTGPVIIENEECRSILSQEITIPLSSRSIGPSPMKLGIGGPSSIAMAFGSSAGSISSVSSRSVAASSTSTKPNVVVVPTMSSADKSNYNTTSLASKLAANDNKLSKPLPRPRIPQIPLKQIDENNNSPKENSNNKEEKAKNEENENENEKLENSMDSPKLPLFGGGGSHIEYNINNSLNNILKNTQNSAENNENNNQKQQLLIVQNQEAADSDDEELENIAKDLNDLSNNPENNNTSNNYNDNSNTSGENYEIADDSDEETEEIGNEFAEI